MDTSAEFINGAMRDMILLNELKNGNHIMEQNT